MNLFNAAMWPINFRTSFLVYGGCIWRIAFILSRLASMPLVDTKHPNTLPRVTPKMHFSGLSLSMASRILVKVFVRSDMYKALFLLATTCHPHTRVRSSLLGPLMPPSSFFKMWGLRCTAPLAFSYSNTCQMVL
jgi:hypothetical protein